MSENTLQKNKMCVWHMSTNLVKIGYQGRAYKKARDISSDIYLIKIRRVCLALSVEESPPPLAR